MGNKEDLDIELVAKMARSHAHVTVLFMGETYLNSQLASRVLCFMHVSVQYVS
jgi:hypothetical protein